MIDPTCCGGGECHNEESESRQQQQQQQRTNSSNSNKQKACRPLHKAIRKHEWDKVMRTIPHLNDPALIARVNGVGWSSLTLAIYHAAPLSVLSAMMMALLCITNNKQKDKQQHSLQAEKQESVLVTLLSTPVPNGKRLPLHFAVRYYDTLEAIQLLVEPYPRALLARSEPDGNTPLDRAIYYRKDASVLQWLKKETQQQELALQRETMTRLLQQEVRQCCELRHEEQVVQKQRRLLQQQQQVRKCCNLIRHEQQQPSERQTTTTTTTNADDDDDIITTTNDEDAAADFCVQIYSYATERELMGLFDEIVSYVGFR